MTSSATASPARSRPERISIPSLFGLLKDTVREWSEHRALRLGAALAFYTTFAIAPLFIIVLAIAGFLFGEEAARKELFNQISGLVGKQGGEAIQSVVASANQPASGAWASVIAAVTLCIGATGVFVQLQDALNSIWEVRREHGKGIWFFIRDRLLSFAMVLAIAFLLLVSLIISAGLAALGKVMSGLLPAQQIIWQVINFTLSLGLSGLLFALIFKVLPDVTIRWRDVWVGALGAAILFNLGKFVLGLYLGRSSVTSAYGAAGSLVIILLWVYYSSQTLFLGAEFTRLYSQRYGQPPRPVAGATFVTQEEGEREGRSVRHQHLQV